MMKPLTDNATTAPIQATAYNGQRNAPAVAQARDLHCGLITLRAETVDAQARTVEAVVATEQIVTVYDMARDEVIDEVLTVAGAELPDRVVLLANHLRHDLDLVLGGASDFHIKGETIVARLTFDDDERSDRAWHKVVRGFLTDVSAGYRVHDAENIPAGESRTINGRRYEARSRRLRVATRWTIREVSVVPVGADPAAKFRAEAGDTATSAVSAERARVTEIEAMRNDQTPADLIDAAVSEGWTSGQTATCILRHWREGIAWRQAAPSLPTNAPAVHTRNPGSSEQARALAAGLCLRSGVSFEDLPTETGLAPDRRRQVQERLATQGERFARLSMPDLCAEALAIEGRSMPVDRRMMVRSALSTSTLQHAFENSVNARFSRGYASAEDSSRQWCEESDVSNFKPSTDITLGKSSGMGKLARGGTARQASIADDAEVYRLARYATRFEVDEQDILDGADNIFAEIPDELGDEAAQLRPDLVYSILLSNPSLNSDGIAIFNAAHNNLTDAALGHAGVKAGLIAMAKQRRNGRPLNLQGRHVIVPIDTRLYARQLVESTTIRGSASADGVKNTLADENLNVVADGRLGAAGVTDPSTGTKYTGSDTRWLLAAERRTIQVVYLAGTNRQPSVRSYMLEKGRWGMGWDIELSIAAFAREYRGLYSSTGTA